MTENKRFKVVGNDNFFQHIEDTTLTEDKHEGSIYDIYQVVKVLNALHNENERLKSENEELRNELKQILNDNEFEWLRNNTVWEQMPLSKRTVTKSTLIENNGGKND